ncbi:MAG: DUF1552 domain-containing protein [Lentisphaerales bacterium]|nr:DUF1552 domain-containing protein [Lentisphaerales bacterium]
MNRRFFTFLGLPMLLSATKSEVNKTKRFICMANPFGMYPESFWPKTLGKSFEMTETLKPLKEFKEEISLFANMTHGVRGGHPGQQAALTTILPSQAVAFADGMQSLDQKITEYTQAQTRFASLVLGIQKPGTFRCSLSWTRNGTLIPTIYSPEKLFSLLFKQPSDLQKKATRTNLHMKKSILDGVLSELKSQTAGLSINDQQKVNEYVHSVREVEKSIQNQQAWLSKPIPKVNYKVKSSLALEANLNSLVDLASLAIQTDQTRVITLDCDSGYHGLSHHGKLHDKISELVKIEQMQMRAFARLIKKLKSVNDPLHPEDTLLDNTIVLFISGLGNGNSHSNDNLPVILAGGGFKHGRYVREELKLGHLFVSILEKAGIVGGFKNFKKPFPGYS